MVCRPERISVSAPPDSSANTDRGSYLRLHHNPPCIKPRIHRGRNRRLGGGRNYCCSLVGRGECYRTRRFPSVSGQAVKTQLSWWYGSGFRAYTFSATLSLPSPYRSRTPPCQLGTLADILLHDEVCKHLLYASTLRHCPNGRALHR